MRDLRSTGEISRGHWNGDAERNEAGAGAEESPDAMSSCRDRLLAMCGAVNTFSDALNEEGQL